MDYYTTLNQDPAKVHVNFLPISLNPSSVTTRISQPLPMRLKERSCRLASARGCELLAVLSSNFSRQYTTRLSHSDLKTVQCCFRLSTALNR